MKSARFILGGALSFVLAFSLAPKVFAITDEDLEILSINPGYTVDSLANTGEFVELRKKSDGESISLTDVSLRYTTKSGSQMILYAFADDSEMTGDTLLLRFSKSETTQADLSYYFNGANGIAAGGGKIELLFEDEVLDEVCWKNYPDCETATFSSVKPTSLVKNLNDEFEHVENYVPDFTIGRQNINIPEQEEDPVILPQCRDIQFSEIFTYYESARSEQFIEFYNNGDDQVKLDGCQVRYKNKNYELSGIVLPGEFFVYYPTEFSLTKNPTNSNVIELIDVDDVKVDSLTYYNGQKKAMSFAQFGYDTNGKEQWEQTFAVTPGTSNIFQEYKTCEEGKVLNEETGNCVKATTLKTTLAECPEGSYRNPLTNRCKKYSTTTGSSMSACADGYERNPETNRCRKITTNAGADYELAKMDSFEEKSSFAAVWAIIGVGALGFGYVIYQYREEILKFFKRKK